jgi:ribosomal protein S18 acetylase RimI-like enzyme
MVDLEIVPLSAEVEAGLVALDALMRRTRGDDYSHQDWGAAEFRRELPGKQALSLVARTEQGQVAGFWIASRRRRTAHTHRVAVDPDLRRSGVGRLMFESFREAAASLGCEVLTVSLAEANDAARRFYESLGFRPVQGDELREFVETTGRPGVVRNGRVLEEGRAYVIMSRRLDREEA